MDGSATKRSVRDSHVWEFVGVRAHWISSQVQLEQNYSLNSHKRHPKTSLSEGLNRFRKNEKGTILKRNTAGRPDVDREKRKDEKQTLKLTVL